MIALQYELYLNYLKSLLFLTGIFVFIFLPNISIAQEIPSEEKKIHIDAAGNVFVNQSLEVYLFISAEDNTNNKLLLESGASESNFISFNRHGIHVLTHTDPLTNKQTHYEVFADGNAPTSELEFHEGLIMKYENRYYCQGNTVFSIKAHDKEAGVSHSYYSIDGPNYIKWDGAKISAPDKPNYIMNYYSVDNVGNIEKPNIAHIYFDMESVVELEEIFFDHNCAEINIESQRQLNELAKSLRDFPELRILLMSHTDSRGTASYNLRLSRQRAESAKRYLVARGIHPSRIETKGYGETMIRNECVEGVECPDEKHKENRRTEFMILPFKN